MVLDDPLTLPALDLGGFKKDIIVDDVKIVKPLIKNEDATEVKPKLSDISVEPCSSLVLPPISFLADIETATFTSPTLPSPALSSTIVTRRQASKRQSPPQSPVPAPFRAPPGNNINLSSGVAKSLAVSANLSHDEALAAAMLVLMRTGKQPSPPVSGTRPLPKRGPTSAFFADNEGADFSLLHTLAAAAAAAGENAA
jgi:hypothetical protein